jgi:phenylacetic acid degradation operon negative regulatory protein
MIHDDGAIVASEVYDVGDLLGFTVHQVRLVFARLVTEGLFTQQGRGRSAVLRATERHDVLHGPEVDWLALAYEQDAGRAPWDGQWHLVSFSIEEERREVRNEFREILIGMGGAAIAGGLYVQALDWSDDIRSTAKRLDIVSNVITATTSDLEVGGSAHAGGVAKRLWPLDEIATEYSRFADRYSAVDTTALGGPVEQLAASIEMSTEFEACIRRDPLLPPELLPQPWPGTAARQVLRERSTQLVDARRETGHLALFSRYDKLFESLER